MPRAASIPMFALSLLIAAGASAGESSKGSLETTTQFLEYRADESLIVYELTMRNVGNLPLSYIALDSEPASVEGAFLVDELGSGGTAKRTFSFLLEPEQRVFQPRFRAVFTDHDGERILSEEERSPLATNIDFSYCDVNAGWLDMDFTLSNLGDEPLLFLVLRSENPPLSGESLKLDSLGPGEGHRWTLEFQLEPGETLFNPTLHLEYYAFGVSGTRLQKKFFTFLQEDLRKVEMALAERGSEGGDQEP